MRVSWIDSTKGIAIYCIVVGHFSNIATQWIYLFHIPIFFFLGGVLSFPDTALNLKRFFSKKFKTLMWPFYKYSLILLPYWILVERFYRPSGEMVLWYNSFWGLVYANGNQKFWLSYGGAIWFLPVYFSAILIFYFIQKRNLHLILKIALSFIVFFCGFYFSKAYNFNLPFGFNIAMVSIFWVLLGYLFSRLRYLELIDSISSFKVIGISIIFLLGILQCNLNLDLYSLTIGDNLMDLMSNTIVGIAFCLSLGVLFKRAKILKVLGEVSLAIMCVHQPIGRIVLYLISKSTNLNIEAIKDSYWSLVIAIFVVSIILILGKLEFYFHKQLDRKWLYKLNIFY